jgi:hypothetical protein
MMLVLLFGQAVHAAPAPEPVKKSPRVLLAAGSPTREFQFVRALFVNEMEAKRAEVSVYLQTMLAAKAAGGRNKALVPGVPAEAQLKDFPDLMKLKYDVVVAFDLDWSRLTEKQLAGLKKWLQRRGGGLIFIGGPVNTHPLALAGADRGKLKPLLELMPVVLEDHRLLEARDASKPWRLNFAGDKSHLPFMKLEQAEPSNKNPLAGWEEFFTGNKEKNAKAELQRGFYSYYPVREVHEDATILATVSDPSAKLKSGKEQPYLVLRAVNQGKVLWMGSGEQWRLRQYKIAYYERFWVELAHYIGAGASRPK